MAAPAPPTTAPRCGAVVFSGGDCALDDAGLVCEDPFGVRGRASRVKVRWRVGGGSGGDVGRLLEASEDNGLRASYLFRYALSTDLKSLPWFGTFR